VVHFDHFKAVRRAVDAALGQIVLLGELALALTAESNPSNTSGENCFSTSTDGALSFTKLGLTATSSRSGVVDADLGEFVAEFAFA